MDMARSDGYFKKGHDLRRYVHNGCGITDFRKRFGELAMAGCADALKYIVETVNDKNAHPKLRLVASQELCNRVMGTPVNTLIVKDMDTRNTDIDKMSNKDIEAMLMLTVEGQAELLKLNVELDDKYPNRKAHDKPVIESESLENSTAPGPESAVKESLKQVGVKQPL